MVDPLFIPGPPKEIEARIAYNSGSRLHEFVFWTKLVEGMPRRREELKGIDAARLLSSACSIERMTKAAGKIGPLFDGSVYRDGEGRRPVAVFSRSSHSMKVYQFDEFYRSDWEAGEMAPLVHIRNLRAPCRLAFDNEFGEGWWGSIPSGLMYIEERDRPLIEPSLALDDGKARFFRTEPVLDWIEARAVLCLVLRAALGREEKGWDFESIDWKERVKWMSLDHRDIFDCPYGVAKKLIDRETTLTLPVRNGFPGLYQAFLMQRADLMHSAVHMESGTMPKMTRRRAVFDWRSLSGRERARRMVQGLVDLHALGCDPYLDCEEGGYRWSMTSNCALSVIYRSLCKPISRAASYIRLCGKCGCVAPFQTKRGKYCSDSCRNGGAGGGFQASLDTE